MRVSIIVAAHNEGDALSRTIESCIQTAHNLDFEIVVVDDASTDGSVDDVQRCFPQVRVHRHSQRLGASPAKATGARHASGEILIFLDGHSNPALGSLTRLVHHVSILGDIVVTPAIANLDVRLWRNDLDQVGHGYFLNLQTFECGWQPLDQLRKVREKSGILYESPSLIGCALAVSRFLYEKLWGFDRHMSFWGVEDLDFGLKCWLMGYRVLHDAQAVVGHRFRSSFDNYAVPLEHVLVNQLRMARKNFTETVWGNWVDRCRQRYQGGLAGHPEGLWALAWHLFEKQRDSVDQERSYLHALRARDEFWFAERFGLDWPRLQTTGVPGEFRELFLAPSASPSPSPPPPKLQIIDRKTGAVVTGTITKIVGQKIQLSVQTVPARPMSNIQWTVPGQPIKNYTQSAAAGTRTDLAAADLQATNLDFYWIAGGTFTVQVTATVGGSNLTASVTVNVLAPTGVSMTSVTGAVAVSDPGFGTGLQLHFGNTTTVGINWTFKCTAPANGAGQIAATQLVNTVRTRTPNAAPVQTLTSAGALVLDTTTPYDPAVPIAASAEATWTSNDSPGQGLTPAFTNVTIDDRFEIYLQYQPAGADSIFVTVGKLSWSWGGQTTRGASPPPNNWGPPVGAHNSTNPAGVASTDLPVWTKNVISLTFV